MKAIHSHVVNVKKIPSRQVVQIIAEIPAEHYAQAVTLFDDKRVLITEAALEMPYGVVSGNQPQEAPEPEKKGGELSKWCAMRCNESEFRWWLADQFNKSCQTPEDAKQLICDFCGIESRRELDHDPKAMGIFKDHILKPWSKFKGGDNGC